MAISLLVLLMLRVFSSLVAAVLAYHLLPFVVTVYSRLKGLMRMLEAAEDLGASRFTILRKSFCLCAAVAAGIGVKALPCRWTTWWFFVATGPGL